MREGFNFLVTGFGFKMVSAEDCSVRYESDAVIVVVTLDPVSQVIYLGVLPQNAAPGTVPYAMPEIVALTDPKVAAAYEEWNATDPMTVSRGILLLARDMRLYGADALRRDAACFERLAAARPPRDEAGSEQRLRDDALAAWRLRDFATVVSDLTTLGKHLTDVEKKRLKYALAKVTPAN